MEKVHETTRIKSGAWDENGVFIYATQSHVRKVEFLLYPTAICVVKLNGFARQYTSFKRDLNSLEQATIPVPRTNFLQTRSAVDKRFCKGRFVKTLPEPLCVAGELHDPQDGRQRNDPFDRAADLHHAGTQEPLHLPRQEQSGAN